VNCAITVAWALSTIVYRYVPEQFFERFDNAVLRRDIANYESASSDILNLRKSNGLPTQLLYDRSGGFRRPARNFHAELFSGRSYDLFVGADKGTAVVVQHP
jgi:hypothetical protein